MTTTILKVSRNAAGRERLVRALADAGLGAVEVADWEQARERLAQCDCAVLVCDPDSVDGDARGLRSAIDALGSRGAAATAVPSDTLRALSHELRTPLSAMSGWLHLMEAGKLDDDGLKRAIAKLRRSIEDQVRTLDRHLANRTQEGNP